ncbi:hypothetical protein KM043_012368 [Ampulex compressa]|nr:hypothetical protein KM043_012368 [Ampulex compressa]
MEYDEDVLQNSFFQEIQKHHEPVLRRAALHNWIVCVPRLGSFIKDMVREDDVHGHILVPSKDFPTTHLHTLTGKQVNVANKELVVKDQLERTFSSRLLFEETFYNEDLRKYRVWCVEPPLEFGLTMPITYPTAVTSVQDAIAFVLAEISEERYFKDTLHAINKFEHTHIDFDTKSVDIQRDLVGTLYVQCLQALLKDTRLRERSLRDEYFYRKLRVSTETYLLHFLQSVILESVAAQTSDMDAELNKILRNLADLRLNDLGVRADLYEDIHVARLNLCHITHFVTVVGKTECLKRTVECISYGVSCVSSDDILPALVFLVIKTGLPNWVAQLTFMKQFRFSMNVVHEADEAAFLITSFEAAVEYIRSGAMSNLLRDVISYAEGASGGPAVCRAEKDHGSASMTDLFFSIKEGDLIGVKEILSNSALYKTPGNAFCHPLCRCDACEKNLAVCRLSKQLAIRLRNDSNLSALHVAVFYGQLPIMEFLLRHAKIDVNISDGYGRRPLHYAAIRGNQNAILLLLHANAEPKLLDIESNTALHFAADHGHEGCVKALLYYAEQNKSSLDTNVRNANGDTALHRASKWGYEGIVRILLEYGADCMAVNRRKETPFTLAHNKRAFNLLARGRAISHEKANTVGQSDSTRASAAVSGAAALLALPEANPKERHEAGREPPPEKTAIDKVLAAIRARDVCLACFYLGLERRSERVVPGLSACHPLCDCTDCASSTDLTEQRSARRTVPINARNHTGETALHAASAIGCAELVQLLLDAGANVNVFTEQRRTPLHVACASGNVPTVKLLLNCGTCEVNAKDRNGETPLHLVAKAGDARLFKLLVRFGGDVDVRNTQGLTPCRQLEKTRQ